MHVMVRFPEASVLLHFRAEETVARVFLNA